ncbi:MAG: hypothetical protein OXH29_00200 [bacterium]|nr:hypothetical protein [bacterium]
MFRRSAKKEQAGVKYRRRSWFGGCYRHDDKGDPLAGALVAISIIAFIGLVGTSYFQFIDRGQAAVVQQVQEGIRADVTQMVGQRIDVPATNGAASTAAVVNALNSINTDGQIKYVSIFDEDGDGTFALAAGSNAQTVVLTGDGGDDMYDIEVAEANKHFWVFAPHTTTYLCDTSGSTAIVAADVAPEHSATASVLGTAGQLDDGDDIDEPNGGGVGECGATAAVSVRSGRAIYVGGVTDTGSHFCIKYAQSNKAIDSNGFSYWHVNGYPTGAAKGSSGTTIDDIQADCGMRWLVNAYYGIEASSGDSYPAHLVGPGLCAHSDPRPSPQNIPACNR